MNIEASSIHASPVSQPDVPLVSAPPLDISHHVTEEFVPVPTPVDNAPPALDTATPARSGISQEYLEVTGRNDRRKETSPPADARSGLTQFPLPHVKTSNFFSCSLALPPQSNGW